MLISNPLLLGQAPISILTTETIMKPQRMMFLRMAYMMKNLMPHSNTLNLTPFWKARNL